MVPVGTIQSNMLQIPELLNNWKWW